MRFIENLVKCLTPTYLVIRLFCRVDEGNVELARVAVVNARLALTFALAVEGLHLAVRIVARVEVLGMQVFVLQVAMPAFKSITVSVSMSIFLRVAEELFSVFLAVFSADEAARVVVGDVCLLVVVSEHVELVCEGSAVLVVFKYLVGVAAFCLLTLD